MGKWLITRWLRNKAVAHRTITQDHTWQQKREEEKQRQRQLNRRKGKLRKIEDAAAAVVNMQKFLTKRSHTLVEKMNIRRRKLEEVREKQRRAQKRRK